MLGSLGRESIRATRHMTPTIEPADGRGGGGEDGTAGFWKGAFQSLVETYPEPVFVVDGDGEITDWNDHMVDLLGYTEEEVLGRNA